MFAGVVDANGRVVVGQQVAQQLGHQAWFLVDGHGRALLLTALPHVDPNLVEVVQVGEDVVLRAVRGRGANDHAAVEVVLVAELLDDAAQPGALFATVDLARDADVVHRRHEHQEAARQRDVAGQTSALGAKRLLGHLDDHVLAFFQQLFNLRLGRVFLALFAVATAAAAATPFAALPARRRDFHGALGTGTLGTIGTIGTLGTFGTLVVVIVLVVLIQVGDDVGDIEEAVAFETNVHE